MADSLVQDYKNQIEVLKQAIRIAASTRSVALIFFLANLAAAVVATITVLTVLGYIFSALCLATVHASNNDVIKLNEALEEKTEGLNNLLARRDYNVSS